LDRPCVPRRDISERGPEPEREDTDAGAAVNMDVDVDADASVAATAVAAVDIGVDVDLRLRLRLIVRLCVNLYSELQRSWHRNEIYKNSVNFNPPPLTFSINVMAISSISLSSSYSDLRQKNLARWIMVRAHGVLSSPTSLRSATVVRLSYPQGLREKPEDIS
jgi:hypothetical protein